MKGTHVSELDEARVRQHLDQLTKPPGSLGRLEDLATRLCRVTQSLEPVTRPRRTVLFAGDHGVVAEGVSAWPSEVTSLMVANIRGGGAASCALARAVDSELVVCDVGSLSPVEGEAGHVRHGTRNLALEAALTVDEFEAAVEAGRSHARQAAEDGMGLLATGEMGIGNTTAASCLAVLLAGVPVDIAVGRGAGADDETLARKQGIVERAVAREAPRLDTDPLAAMAAVAGLEIAAMAGFFLGAREARVPCVVDGLIATSAALVAQRIDATVVEGLIASHRSVEPAHAGALGRLGLEAWLDWGLRLGEGSGALLLFPMLDAAAEMVGGMATFADLGIGGDGGDGEDGGDGGNGENDGGA